MCILPATEACIMLILYYSYNAYCYSHVGLILLCSIAPEDDTPVPKHVGVFNTCYELYFVKCVCW